MPKTNIPNYRLHRASGQAFVELGGRRFYLGNKAGQVQPSQRDRSRPNAARPGDQYTKDSYNRAVNRACEAANVPAWTPNQLRHSTGTEARSKYGLDAAQVYLGHANASTTEIYAELDFEKAAKVAREIG